MKLKIYLSLAIMFVAFINVNFALAQENPGKFKYQKIDDTLPVYDPLEEFNRVMYKFNYGLDKIIIKPAAKAYRYVVPRPVRRGIRNALYNLTEPVTVVNSVLQLDIKNSLVSTWRFAINSTVGLAGLFDVAKHLGLKKQKEDFGQTLGKYGVGAGPYIILPILGPSNGRDIVGKIADYFTDPFNYEYVIHTDAVIARKIISGIDTRESLLSITNKIDKYSLDPYTSTRSLYNQYRDNQIANGEKVKK